MYFNKVDDIYNEFLKMGYSEKDSLNLTKLAVDVACEYSGYIDISEASNALINMFKKEL